MLTTPEELNFNFIWLISDNPSLEANAYHTCMEFENLHGPPAPSGSITVSSPSPIIFCMVESPSTALARLCYTACLKIVEASMLTSTSKLLYQLLHLCKHCLSKSSLHAKTTSHNLTPHFNSQTQSPHWHSVIHSLCVLQDLGHDPKLWEWYSGLMGYLTSRSIPGYFQGNTLSWPHIIEG
jgi:hypothetical protein